MEYKVDSYAIDQVFSTRIHDLKYVPGCEVLRFVEASSGGVHL